MSDSEDSSGPVLKAKIEAEDLEYDLKASSIFMMDETGVQLGTPSVSQRFLVSAGASKTLRPAIIDGSQELTTVLECIAADGSVLLPLYAEC
ncbi:hypothetical protein CF335_g6485 [Tilletia laevis]|nr:hypothetical protein CF335_g6485 [Tilletia laevis]